MRIGSNCEAQIQQICRERSIKTLAHFTRIENLSSILQKGLLSRKTLETGSQQFLFNDRNRIDSHKDATCLSISFPNYRMFNVIREEKRKDNGVDDSQWIVLLLYASVLWELDCAFCQENASSNNIRHIPLEDRKGHEALEAMFVQDFYDTKHDIWISRQDLSIPDDYPTNPQAEVLVFEPIPVQYIKAIYFQSETALEKWCFSNSETYLQKYFHNSQYFYGRCDWKIWKSDNLTGDDSSELDEPPEMQPDLFPISKILSQVK